MVVSLTDSGKSYLPFLRFDYSDAGQVALAAMEQMAIGTTCAQHMIMLISQMPWDFWLIFAFIGVVIPWRGRARLQRLLSLPRVGTREKLSLYATTIAFQWALAMAVAWRALARGMTTKELGFSHNGVMEVLLPGLLGSVVLGSLHWLNLRRVGKMEGPAPELMRKIAARILPRNLIEFLAYAALAITAGVCEEFLYRGFAMAALTRAGLPIWLVVPLTALLFGLAHTYQGRNGVAGTSAMGLVFGGFRVLTDSLFPVTMWHATVDLVAGLAGPKYLLSADEEEQAGRESRATG